MKRVILIVIDSMGCGAMPDCEEYSDVKECNTLSNVAHAVGGLNIPNLSKLGLANIVQVEGAKRVENPIGQYAKLAEKSKGKDTTTGHWEIAGLVLDKPFRTYPYGFPKEVIDEFIEKTGCGGVLANCPASGTAIIEQLYKEHQRTQYPIVYTSADSVFQIAVDIDVVPLDTLYDWCRIAREILNGEYNTSRVIARPFWMVSGKPVRISKDRRDFSVPPPAKTILNRIEEKNGVVVGIGKIEDIFVKSGVTYAVHTGSNTEGLDLTIKAVQNKLNLKELKVSSRNIFAHERELIFTNLVDTDMLYGHRNDAHGYARAIEEIDSRVPDIIDSMKDDDLLIITADHGCDPTVEGTDHTREYVPLVMYHKNMEPKDLGLIKGFDFISSQIKSWLKM